MLYRREIFVKGYQMGINIRVKFSAKLWSEIAITGIMKPCLLSSHSEN